MQINSPLNCAIIMYLAIVHLFCFLIMFHNGRSCANKSKKIKYKVQTQTESKYNFRVRVVQGWYRGGGISRLVSPQLVLIYSFKYLFFLLFVFMTRIGRIAFIAFFMAFITQNCCCLCSLELHWEATHATCTRPQTAQKSANPYQLRLTKDARNGVSAHFCQYPLAHVTPSCTQNIHSCVSTRAWTYIRRHEPEMVEDCCNCEESQTNGRLPSSVKQCMDVNHT